jgi:hypothetical protein
MTTCTKTLISFLFVFSVSAISGCSGQEKKKYSLLTWEYKREGDGVVPGISAFVLVKYSLSDSGYIRNEVFRTNYYIPHYSHFKTNIYKNRYLINTRGDVFDLQTGKMIHDNIGSDVLIEQWGDSVLFWHTDYQPDFVFPPDTVRHNAIKSKYYFFDIKNGKINPLIPSNDLIRTFPLSFPDKIRGSMLSPDKKLIAHFIPRKYELQNNLPVNGPDFMACAWSRIFPTLGDLYVSYSKTDSVKIADSVTFNFSIWFTNQLPIIWLNNEELLTQQNNGSLIKINVRTKALIRYPALDAMACSWPTFFEKTATGEIIYHCRGKNGDLFKVDTETGIARLSTVINISKAYSISPKSGYPGNEYVNGYFHNDKKILDDTTATLHYAITNDDLIAIQCKEVIPSRNQYDQWNTIKIFDPEKNEWTDIKVEYLQQLIGWIKEK